MGIYKRDGSEYYWMSYTVGKRRVRESTGTKLKAAAQALYAKTLTREYDRQHFPGRVARSVSLEDLREAWVLKSKNKRSLAADEQRFKTLVELLPATLDRITRKEVEALRHALLARKVRGGKAEEDSVRTMSVASANRHLALLRSALRYARDCGWVKDVPPIKLMREDNQRTRECSPEELKALRERAQHGMRQLITIAYATGMRRGEITGLTWPQVDLEAGMIRVPATKTKTGQPLAIAMHPVVREAFEELGPKKRGAVFSMLCISRVSHYFRDLCRAAGIEDLRLHDLRHTAASNLRRAGVDILTIQQFTGHKSVTMLSRYQHHTDNDLKAAAKSVAIEL